MQGCQRCQFSTERASPGDRVVCDLLLRFVRAMLLGH